MAADAVVSWLIPFVLDQCKALIQSELSTILTATGDLQKLERILTDIQAVLSDAEEKQIKSQVIANWLSQLREAGYDAQDVLDEFRFEILSRRILRENSLFCGRKSVRQFFSSRNPVLVKRKMGKLVKKIVNQLDEIAEEKSKYSFESNSSANSISNIETFCRGQTAALVIESDIIGRGMDKEIIIGKITSEKCVKKDISVLPIVGMGGIGKTTLAQLVYNDERIQTRFEYLIWISVGDQFDISMIFDSILEALNKKDCTILQFDLLQRRVREVLRGKKFFVVLDDLWSEDFSKWDDFINVLKIGSKGSVILVTTRKEQVGEKVRTLGAHRLACLSETESWDLFKARAFANCEEENENLISIGRKIVKKCDGLPLACKALGVIMRIRKEEREWEHILDSEIWEIENENEQILSSLRVSYHHLLPFLKRCFGFCAIFPKGREIDKDMLIHLWMANGFIPETGRTDPFEMGCEIFKQLVKGCFFQDVTTVEKWYEGEIRVLFKIHDMMLDLARSVSLEECFLFDRNDYFASSKIRYLGLNLYDDLVNNENFSNLRNLRSFIFTNQNRNFISSRFVDILNGNKCLRALDLSHTKLPNIGISFYNFKRLRYLNLSYTNIVTLPNFVTDLVYLQTLYLNHCEFLRELPKDTKNLINLKHLYLNGCVNLRKMPIKLGKLKKLRTLNKFVVCNELGSGTLCELRDLKLMGVLLLSKLQNVKNLIEAQNSNLNLKEKIEGLILEWEMNEEDLTDSTMDRNHEMVFEALKPSNELKMICVKGFCGVILPNWFMYDLVFFKNLKEISVSNCERVTDLPPFGRLKSLEVLEIHEMNSVQIVRDRNQDINIAFPSLKYLKLTNMASLTYFYGLYTILANRFKLKIKECPELATIPQIQTIQNLEFENCPQIRPYEGFFSSMIHLEKMVINKCDNLISLLEEEKNESRIPIKELIIKDCSETMFNKLPNLGLWKCFISLNHLSIDSCEGLVIFPEIFIKQLISLKYLVISYCPNLIGSSEINGLELHHLTNLETLSINQCEKLSDFSKYALKFLNSLNIIQLVGLKKMLNLPELPESLNELLISDCTGIRFLPENICYLKSLARLQIKNLINFDSFPKEMGELIGLEELVIINCPKLNEFPKNFEKQLEKLKCLWIKNCEQLGSKCKSRGNYWSFVSQIKYRRIEFENGYSDEESSDLG
ncbi:hypothetical protein LUZ60_013224 [Juncus effusus]|nr:hypothetical protein LUZ60_013224 [Juncus effusus]